MFPYAMLATMPLFSHVDWPKKLPAVCRHVFNTDPPRMSSHCLYPTDETHHRSLEKHGKVKPHYSLHVKSYSHSDLPVIYLTPFYNIYVFCFFFVFFHPWCPDGRAGGGKKFVWVVSQKP